MADGNRQPQRVHETARKYELGREPAAAVLTNSTAGERLELVAVLTRRAWELGGRPWPAMPRSEWPVTVVRPP